MTTSGGAGGIVVRPLVPADCYAVADLDVVARTTATLAFLGPRFYAILYRAVLASGGAFGFVAETDRRIAGFVLGAVDGPRALRSALRRALPSLAVTAVAAVLRHPRRVPLLCSALRYPSTTHGPELLVISVGAAWQRRGVARALVSALDEAFVARRIDRYRVSTKVETVPAVAFYDALGYVRVGAFDLFAEPWLIFERQLFNDAHRR
jgi:ribosomal protein S18 acetylase RimI-like enzyme